MGCIGSDHCVEQEELLVLLVMGTIYLAGKLF